MATKQSGCLGTILSAAFTSVVAPILVGLALHDLNAGDARVARGGAGWTVDGASRAEAGEGTPALPARLRVHAVPDAAPRQLVRPAPSPQTTIAPRGKDWTRPIPLER